MINYAGNNFSISCKFAVLIVGVFLCIHMVLNTCYLGCYHPASFNSTRLKKTLDIACILSTCWTHLKRFQASHGTYGIQALCQHNETKSTWLLYRLLNNSFAKVLLTLLDKMSITDLCSCEQQESTQPRSWNLILQLSDRELEEN